MLRTDEMLPRDTYLRNLFSHRFCLVVRGDANGTPKLTEVLAAGGGEQSSEALYHVRLHLAYISPRSRLDLA